MSPVTRHSSCLPSFFRLLCLVIALWLACALSSCQAQEVQSSKFKAQKSEFAPGATFPTVTVTLIAVIGLVSYWAGLQRGHRVQLEKQMARYHEAVDSLLDRDDPPVTRHPSPVTPSP